MFQKELVGKDSLSGIDAFIQARCEKIIRPKVFLVFTASIDRPKILAHLANQGTKEPAAFLEDMQAYK